MSSHQPEPSEADPQKPQYGTTAGDSADAAAVHERLAREWTTGFFDCSSDVGNFFDSWLLHSCALSTQYHMLYRSTDDDNGTNGQISWLFTFVLIGADVLVMHFGVPVLPFQCVTAAFRLRARQRFGIYNLHANAGTVFSPGNCCEATVDVFVAVLLPPCAIAQVNREYAARGEPLHRVLFGKDHRIYLSPSVVTMT